MELPKTNFSCFISPLPEGHRDGWFALVLKVCAAAADTNPLSDWVFHGTTMSRAGLIIHSGFRKSPILMRVGHDTQSWRSGTVWANPLVASYYAEEAAGGCLDEWPVLIACKVSDLIKAGDLVVDEQSLDVPITSRLSRPIGQIDLQFEAGAKDWKSSYDLVGSFACLGRPGGSDLRKIASICDLDRLIAEVSQPLCRQ